MKQSKLIIGIFAAVLSALMLNSCYVSKSIADKSGAQLWAEHCNRCHNAPGPGEFNNTNWEIVGMHMQVRANISQTEIDKIVDFMKAANN